MQTVSSAITSNSTHFILFGGTNDSWVAQSNITVVSKAALANLNHSDKPQNLFQIIGQLPYSAYDMGLIRDGSSVYLFGGIDQGNHISTILKVDISIYPFNITVVGNLPFGMENPRVLRINDLVYIFGGSNPDAGISQSHIFEFNLTDYSIQDSGFTIPNLSATIYYFNNLVYLIGGVNYNSNTYVRNILVFDPTTNSIHKISNLPSAVFIGSSIQVNNKIIFMSRRNSTYFSNQPMVLDLNSMTEKTYSIPLLSGDNFVSSYQLLFDGGVQLYLVGGMFPTNITLKHSIYRIDLNDVIGNEIVNSANSNTLYQVTNNQSTFLLSKKYTGFNFNDNHSQLVSSFKQIKLKSSDTLKIKMNYDSHSDPDTRQRILIGFTSDTPITKVDTFNTIPSSNFVGIRMQNTIVNNKTYVVFIARVVMNKVSILQKSFPYLANLTYSVEFSFTKLNSTNYYYSMSINGNTFSEIKNSSLNNLTLNSFAIWNENLYTDYPLEGYYKGNVQSFSLMETESVSNSMNLKEILIIALIANFFILVLLSYITFSPRYKYLATGTKPEGVPTALVSLGFYNLYLMLKKAFEKIDKFVAVGLEEDSGDFSGSFPANFDFLQDNDKLIIDYNSLEDMTGLAIKILINLLDYLDHGTYLTNVQLNLGISRSSFYYTINKLKERGFIEIHTTVQDDQRKKFVAISSKGYSLLKLVYNHLDTYFNGNNP